MQKWPILMNSSKTNSDYSTPMTDLKIIDFPQDYQEKIQVTKKIPESIKIYNKEVKP